MTARSVAGQPGGLGRSRWTAWSRWPGWSRYRVGPPASAVTTRTVTIRQVPAIRRTAAITGPAAPPRTADTIK